MEQLFSMEQNIQSKFSRSICTACVPKWIKISHKNSSKHTVIKDNPSVIPFKNLQFRLLATLTLILSILFYSFGYLVIRTLENSYQQSIESTLFTVLKDIKHDYNEEPEKPISFEETQKEFDVPLLYAQIVAYDSLSNTPKILQKSSDLEEQTLMIEPTMIQKIFERPKEILFSKESHSELSHHQLFVGTMFLAQTEFQMLFLQCAIPYNTHTPQIKQ